MKSLCDTDASAHDCVLSALPSERRMHMAQYFREFDKKPIRTKMPFLAECPQKHVNRMFPDSGGDERDSHTNFTVPIGCSISQ